MNHARENVGGVGVPGRRQAVPEWEGLRKEETQMRRALNRWHSRNDLGGSLRVSDQRERKIVGLGESKTKKDDTKYVTNTKESVSNELVTPKGRNSKEEVREPSTMLPAHFPSRANVSPRRMKSHNFLDVPSLGVNRQRSLRQPNYSGKGGAVSRSKSDQGQSGACKTTNPTGLRRSVAKRGQSVRNILSGSHLAHPMPTTVADRQSSAPSVTKSFVSVESQGLASMEEESGIDNSSSQFSATEATANYTGREPASSRPKFEKDNHSSDEIPPSRKMIAKRGLSVRKIRSFDDSTDGMSSGGASWRPKSPMKGPSSKGKRTKPLENLNNNEDAVERQNNSPRSPSVGDSAQLHAMNSPLERGSSGSAGLDKHALPASPQNTGLPIPWPVSPPLHGPLKSSLMSPVRRKGISPVRGHSRRMGENGALSPTRQLSCRSPTLRVVKSQGSVELRRIMPPKDLPVGLLDLSSHLPSTEPKPSQQQKAQNTELAPKGDGLGGLSPTPPSQSKRAAISPMRRVLSSRSLCRSPSKVGFRHGSSKSPVPNRTGSRPSMSQRLLSFRSIVSVNTNVAVSNEIYPNKLGRQPSTRSTTEFASLSRESSGEYGNKVVQRKSLLARMGSFRNSASAAAAAAAAAGDDLTRTSADDDNDEEAARAGAKSKQRQTSQRGFDEGALMQKQQERRTLLARMSRRDLDDKTESTSVSKAVVKVEPSEKDRNASLRESYVPEFIYFRVFSELNDNPDDASVITEAFSIYGSFEGSDFIMDDDTAPPLEYSYANQKQPESDEALERNASTKNPPQNESLLNTCEEILKDDDEQYLLDEDHDDAIIESLLNISPAPRPKIPMMKSLCTRTVWKLDDSDGSLYVDKPEHENVGDDDDEAAYASQVLGELEKVKPQSEYEECQPKKTKVKKKNLRRVEPKERLLIEL